MSSPRSCPAPRASRSDGRGHAVEEAEHVRHPFLAVGGDDVEAGDGRRLPGRPSSQRIRSGGEVLSFLSPFTTFGTAVEVTADEVSIGAFVPADARTAEAVRAAVS